MRERILRAVTGIVSGFFRRISPETARRIAFFVGDIGYLLDWRHRRIAMRNLRMAFGQTKTEAEMRRITRETFRNFSLIAVEFLRIPLLTPEKAKALIKPEQKKLLDECLKRGKGVLLVAYHFGNWEMMAAVGALAGYPISAVAKPMKDSIWNKIINEMRTFSGLRVIARDRSAFAIVKRLARNEIVGILVDQNIRKQKVFVDFFGMKAATTPGPALLALKTGAALIPLFMMRNGLGQYEMIAEGPLDVVSTGDMEADAVRITQTYTSILEKYVSRYPSQWFWLHRRWRTRPPGEPALY